ncbi:MAG: ABC transporter permease [Oscillospiraceae bacterium]|nr:ABC transporter permease [Oscillospiraceae bacterium]
MKLWQSIRMAFQTLLSKKGRTFLTMLGTTIGVTAVIALVSVTKAQNEANKDLWRKMSENMVFVSFYSYEWKAGATPNAVIARDLRDYINNDLTELAVGITTNQQEWGSSVRWKDMIVQARALFYGSEQFSDVNRYEIKYGRDISVVDIERTNPVAVLGSLMCDKIFSFQDPIGETIYINEVPFTIVGVYHQRDKDKPEWYTEEQWYDYSEDNLIVLPYTASRLINPNVIIQDYKIKVEEPDAALELVSLLNDFFSTVITRIEWDKIDWEAGIYPDWDSETGYYNAWTNFQWFEEMDEAEAAQTRFLTLIAAISLFVGGIGIMNIMLVTVTERTREIGVRKAIGAPRRTIVTQFLIEASVLSGAGGLLGVILGFTVTLYWGKLQYDLIAQPDLPITFIAFAGSLAMGIIFGIYPAIKAASLQPVDALRTE